MIFEVWDLIKQGMRLNGGCLPMGPVRSRMGPPGASSRLLVEFLLECYELFAHILYLDKNTHIYLVALSIINK